MTLFDRFLPEVGQIETCSKKVRGMAPARRGNLSMHIEALPRPVWRDEILQDPALLQRYCNDLRAFQSISADPLDRVEYFLWPQIMPAQACVIVNAAFETAALFETNGQLEAARLANNEARLAAGVDSSGRAKRPEIFDGAAMTMEPNRRKIEVGFWRP